MADGRACVCCQDVRGDFVVGDLKTQTLKEIWEVGMGNVKKEHLAFNQEKLPLCDKCDYMESFCMDEDLKSWWPQ